MKPAFQLLLILSLAALVLGQGSRRGQRSSGKGAQTQEGAVQSFINNVLGKISRIGYSVMGVVGSVFAYYKFFRKSKQRKEKINEYIGQWQQKMVLMAASQNRQKVSKLIFDLNFSTQAKISLKSHNQAVSFNIQLTVKEATEDSADHLYTLTMEGEDPQGKSQIQGFACFKQDKLQVLLVLTHDKYAKKEESPIYLFEGEQTGAQTVEGEWWIDGQRGTAGEYSGRFRFDF